MSALVRSPELAELRAFCLAAELGSLGRAAVRLHVSQPALSKRLRSLEAVCGAKLLERSPQGVTLTAAGRRLHAEARRLLEVSEAIEELMVGLQDAEPPIRLACSPTIAETALDDLLAAAGSEGRHLAVEITVVNSQTARSMVASGQADLAFGTMEDPEPSDGVESIPFCSDEVVIAIPVSHRWKSSPEISAEDLCATPMVMRDPQANTRRTVERVLATHGLSLAAPLVEVGSTSAAKAAALRMNAPVLLSELALADAHKEGFLIRRVAGISFHRLFALMLAGGPEGLGPAGRALVDLVRRTAPRDDLPRS